MNDSGDLSIPYAEFMLREDKNEEAIDMLRRPGPPDDGYRCALLARAYFQRGDSKGDLFAANYFAGRAVELDYTEPWLQAIRGVSALRKDRPEEAVLAFQNYVTPESGPAGQHLLGLSLKQCGQYAEAAPWLERAAESAPDHEAYREELDHCRELLKGGSPAPTRSLSAPRFELGGFRDTREDRASPSPSHPLSRLRGHARQPRDFDWLRKSIPCQRECPAHTDIPGYLAANYRGDFDSAYRINLRDNVFPAVLGRVCSRPCESACRHKWDDLGEAVAICFSKRSAADFKTEEFVQLPPWFPDSGQRVAVVGSGPAGLAAARNLALFGHQVTVFEKHRRPGGMMNQGIPKFRLPWAVIDREVEQVRRQGVDIRCDVEIGRDLSMQALLAEHDAVVMAAGTLRPNLLDLPGKELLGIRHGLDFLLEVNETDESELGRHVLVIGGGFTAMDCARTAKRLGAAIYQATPVEQEGAPGSVLQADADLVRVAYRRSVNEMLVTPGELEELEHEGIPMDFMVSPKAYLGDEQGRIRAMQFVRTRLGPPDDSGRRRPEEIAGSDFEVPADTVLLATGQFPDTSWIDAELQKDLAREDGWLLGNGSARTAQANIFAAGDFATGARSLIEAIAHAKDTAREVDTFLMGYERLIDTAVIEDVQFNGRIREMDAVPRVAMPALPLAARDLTGEVEQGFATDQAVEEGQRCYLCHYKYEIDPDKCIYCDWCIKAKPRPACILKIRELKTDDVGRVTGWVEAEGSEDTELIWINQEDCIRCNACVEACPVDAISIQKVSLAVQAVETPAPAGQEAIRY